MGAMPEIAFATLLISVIQFVASPFGAADEGGGDVIRDDRDGGVPDWAWYITWGIMILALIKSFF